LLKGDSHDPKCVEFHSHSSLNGFRFPVSYCVLLLCSLQLISPAKAAPLPEHPLEPVNTSGPRATLRTFMTNAENASKEFKQSGYRTRDALKYIQRAASTLNMSHIPTALHEDVGFESTLQLKVILDNIDVPDLNTVPEAKDFKGSEDLFWRIPHTDITIARVKKAAARAPGFFLRIPFPKSARITD
jgi:hypothetical protein